MSDPHAAHAVKAAAVDDEPKTPMWLPALGAALFVSVGLWWAVTPAAVVPVDLDQAGSASAAAASAAPPAPTPTPPPAPPQPIMPSPTARLGGAPALPGSAAPAGSQRPQRVRKAGAP